MLCCCLMAVSGRAQTYGQMWKKVESLQQQDQPQSVLLAVTDIATKAATERNVPQLLKAYIVRSATRMQLTPDSVAAERAALTAWAEREQEGVTKAVLYHVLGGLWLDGSPKDTQEAIRCFRRSLQERQLLAATPARSFRPMTIPGALSERYFGDNLYDLLVRQAIRKLSVQAEWTRRDAALEECFGWYGQLIEEYLDRGDRTAACLTHEARLWFQIERMGHLRRYALDGTAAERQLRALVEEYADLPVGADAYAKLAEWYYRTDSLQKVVEVANEGLKRYPKGAWTDVLSRYIRMAQRPQLQTRIPFVYPSIRTAVSVSFANLSGVTFEWYRLSVSPLSSQLREDRKEAEWVKRYGRKVASESYALVPRADYRRADTVLQVQLPEAGIYLLKQVPKGHADRAAYTLLRVSPYQAVQLPVDGNHRELTAVDKRTGQPVAGAEVVTYRYEGGEYRLHRRHPLGEKGSVVLELPKEGNFYFHVRTAGNDFMPLERLARAVTETVRPAAGGTNRASLFTDRALYRPGQTVRVSGVVWRQQGDSVAVADGVSQVVTLSSEAEELERQSVVTDKMGTLCADFVLPTSLRPGTYRISVPQATRIIRVEEYRRPTFDVAFQPSPTTYNKGDSVRLTAVATTFAGAPVRTAAVRYRVVCQERWWFRWGPVREEELTAGTAVTDADGQFTVAVRLTAPEWGENAAGQPYWVYRFMAEVTDGAGETRTAQAELPVAEQSVGLQVKGLPEVWLKEAPVPVQFQALNLSGYPVELPVTYRVAAMDRDGRDGTVVLEGQAASNRSWVPEAFGTLPSGRYRLHLQAYDEQGRSCEACQEFTVFSRNDTAVPYETDAWFYQDGSTFSGDAPLTCYVGSSRKEVYLMVDVYSGNRRIESHRTTLDQEVRPFRFSYRPEYGDGLSVSLAFVKEGRLYTRTFRMERALPEKQLTVQWTSFRDRLQPGSREEWQMRVTDRSGKPVWAQLMATLYDASLETLAPHDWHFSLDFVRRIPYYRAVLSGGGLSGYLFSDFPYSVPEGGLRVLDGDYSRLYEPPFWSVGPRYYARPVGTMMKAARNVSAVRDAGAVVKEMAAPAMTEERTEEEADVQAAGTAVVTEELPAVPTRDNFAETAFFYPALQTDSLGYVGWTFTVPDALTRWKLLAFAHTATMEYGHSTATVTTSKEWMVQPNWPRFLRRGDRMVLAASLVNLSMQTVSGKAYLELRNPLTDKVVYRTSCPFAVAEGTTGQVTFEVKVPDGQEVLVGRIVADGGSCADGEQRYLPVLSDRQRVTETVPFLLHDGEERTIRQQELFPQKSRTSADHRLTVELTANPDWYAVQALPVVSEPRTEDALAWGTALYAQSVAAAILEKHPRLREQVTAWQQRAASVEEMAGQLDKNPDLKELLLEETPWLLEARQESEQRRRLALLLELNGMRQRHQVAIDRLKALQGADGAWSWYGGMEGSPYVTVRLVEMLARMRAMGIRLDPAVQQMYADGLEWLKRRAADMYRRQKEQPSPVAPLSPESGIIHYLYCCAIDPFAARMADRTVNDAFCRQLENRSAAYTIREKAMIALVLYGAGRTRQAAALVQSVKEYLVGTPETGRYFDTPKAVYSWEGYRIPTQVAAMEAITRLAPDDALTDSMKLWLLRQKQVQVWESPLATADALYAFFCLGAARPAADGTLRATVGHEQVESPEGGSGYVRRTFTGTDAVRSEVRVRRQGEGIGWGAVYAQYSEELEKISAGSGQGLTVERAYVRNGQRLSVADTLRVGDRVTVRLVLTADRDMDFIQVKDGRAACMEPVESLSGYRWQDGTGYVRMVRDASTLFFIDRLRKGTHVLEYDVFIDRAGTFQTGLATVQSAYAPEWTAHTAGRRWTVRQ